MNIPQCVLYVTLGNVYLMLLLSMYEVPVTLNFVRIFGHV